MRIRIDEIPDVGRFLHFHWDEDRLRRFMLPGDPRAVNLLRPVAVHLEIYKERDHILIQGSLQGSLRVACDRCLETFTWPLEQNVEVFLVQEEGPEEDLELDLGDLEYEFFDGEVIEIDQLIAEQIFLALPFKTLCSEECRGICPRCGANRNLENCRCENQGRRSPFAVLDTVKGKPPTKM